MSRISSSTPWKRMLAACALLVAAVLLAACGDDDTTTTTTAETTTTVTTLDSEAAAAGTTTTPDGQVISTAEADAGSDAATAIPGDQDVVSGEQPEIATTTTSSGPQGGVNGVIGEDPNSGVVLSTTSTTTVDPVTGEPVATTPETVTTTDPDTGQVIVVESAASDSTDSTDGSTVTTGADGTETTVTDATTDSTTVTTGADGTETTVTDATTDATTDTTVTTGADGNETTVTVVPPTTDSTFSTTTVPLTVDPTLGNDEAILSRPFSPDSPWNTSIVGDRVDKNSQRWINESRIRVANATDNASQDEFDVLDNSTSPALRSARDCRDENRLNRRDGKNRDNGLNDGRNENSSNCRTINAGLTINVTKWTDPVFSNAQDDAIERIAICRQFNCGPDAVSSIVIPPNACPDPRYDGWMTVIDNNSRTALDFWRARCENDGSISYHYVKKWDLDGPGFQKPNGVSARGSGLPLFAGLITPEEIRDGEINHALAISVPGAATRRYVQPASRTDGTGLTTSIPEGARMRLKHGAEKALTKRFVRNKDQRRVARTIITALERYGAIVVDRSAAPTLYAQKNANWTNILPLNLIQQIGLDRFEVVQAGPTFFDPPRVDEGTFDPGVTSFPSTGSGSQSVVVSP